MPTLDNAQLTISDVFFANPFIIVYYYSYIKWNESVTLLIVYSSTRPNMAEGGEDRSQLIAHFQVDHGSRQYNTACLSVDVFDSY